MPAPAQAAKARIDLARYELSLDGHRVKLERQPMELLIFFAQRAAQLVTREEIIQRLWGNDVFVDVDRSINAAVRKIRAALHDDPASPRYLETVVGKGYRLVGVIELAGSPAVSQPLAPSADLTPPVAAARRRNPGWIALLLVVITMLAAAIWTVTRWHAGKATPDAPSLRSIAVLPLQNLSGDPSQDYFADGMTEELTTNLGKISSLTVISRTSAQNYRGSHKSAPQIARELHVQAIVEGSVERSGNKVRITTQLIDADHDKHLWAESYDRDIGDVLSVQNAVALEIARQVRIRLTSLEQQRLQQHVPANPDAYDVYLRGRYALTTQSADRLQEALPLFQQAISLDASFAPAYAGLADTYSLLANYSVIPPNEAFPQALAAARKALQLDSQSAEAHTALAFPEHHYFWNWSVAEDEYKAAIALNSSYPTVHLGYAELLSSVGRHDEAIVQMRRALELDPLSPVYSSNLGRFLYHARRYDEAIEVLQQTLARDPGRVYARVHLAMCYEEKGMYAEERRQFELITAAFKGQPGPGLAHFYARSGESLKARRMAAQLKDAARDSDWFFLAGVYAALGDKDEAFACLSKAYEAHDFFLVFLKVHPYMDPLRADPRYTELLHRMGLDR
jgi:TolB-like protein/DNA-binding winged helix-turn-helix (wHTH) protein/thioredoxin-like negative regulator of GroEL